MTTQGAPRLKVSGAHREHSTTNPRPRSSSLCRPSYSNVATASMTTPIPCAPHFPPMPLPVTCPRNPTYQSASPIPTPAAVADQPATEISYSTYSPTPSSIACHRGRNARLRQWVKDVHLIPTPSRSESPLSLLSPDEDRDPISHVRTKSPGEKPDWGRSVGVGSASWSETNASTATVPIEINERERLNREEQKKKEEAGRYRELISSPPPGPILRRPVHSNINDQPPSMIQPRQGLATAPQPPTNNQPPTQPQQLKSIHRSASTSLQTPPLALGNRNRPSPTPALAQPRPSNPPLVISPTPALPLPRDDHTTHSIRPHIEPGNTRSQREAYLATALSLPLDMLSELSDPKVAAKSGGGVVGGDELSLGSKLKIKSTSSLRHQQPQKIKFNTPFPTGPPTSTSQINSHANLLNGSTAAVSEDPTGGSMREKSIKNRFLSLPQDSSLSRSKTLPSNGTSSKHIPVILAAGASGKSAVTSPTSSSTGTVIGIANPSSLPPSTATVVQASRHPLPASITSTIPPTPSSGHQSTHPQAGPSNYDLNVPGGSAIAQSTLQVQSQGQGQGQNQSQPVCRKVSQVSQLFPDSQLSKTASEETIVTASRHQLPPPSANTTVISTTKSSRDHKGKSREIDSNAVIVTPSLDIHSKPLHSKSQESQYPSKSPTLPSSHSIQPKAESYTPLTTEEEDPPPLHRQQLPLRRPALTSSNSVDALGVGRKHRGDSTTTLQTRFEPAMYPLPPSVATALSSPTMPAEMITSPVAVGTGSAPPPPSPILLSVPSVQPQHPLPVAASDPTILPFQVPQPIQPQAIVPASTTPAPTSTPDVLPPVSSASEPLVPTSRLQFSPSTKSDRIEGYVESDNHVSFEVPSGSRGRLRVSLTWIPSARRRTRQEVVTVATIAEVPPAVESSKPPKVPPKSPSMIRRQIPSSILIEHQRKDEGQLAHYNQRHTQEEDEDPERQDHQLPPAEVRLSSHAQHNKTDHILDGGLYSPRSHPQRAFWYGPQPRIQPLLPPYGQISPVPLPLSPVPVFQMSLPHDAYPYPTTGIWPPFPRLATPPSPRRPPSEDPPSSSGRSPSPPLNQHHQYSHPQSHQHPVPPQPNPNMQYSTQHMMYSPHSVRDMTSSRENGGNNGRGGEASGFWRRMNPFPRKIGVQGGGGEERGDGWGGDRKVRAWRQGVTSGQSPAMFGVPTYLPRPSRFGGGGVPTIEESGQKNHTDENYMNGRNNLGRMAGQQPTLLSPYSMLHIPRDGLGGGVGRGGEINAGLTRKGSSVWDRILLRRKIDEEHEHRRRPRLETPPPLPPGPGRNRGQFRSAKGLGVGVNEQRGQGDVEVREKDKWLDKGERRRRRAARRDEREAENIRLATQQVQGQSGRRDGFVNNSTLQVGGSGRALKEIQSQLQRSLESAERRVENAGRGIDVQRYVSDHRRVNEERNRRTAKTKRNEREGIVSGDAGQVREARRKGKWADRLPRLTALQAGGDTGTRGNRVGRDVRAVGGRERREEGVMKKKKRRSDSGRENHKAKGGEKSLVGILAQKFQTQTSRVTR